MDTHTIRLHRVLKASPALVYKAFLDPDALSRWLPPDGYLCKVFQLLGRQRGLQAVPSRKLMGQLLVELGGVSELDRCHW